jgi:hypothetical protein
VFRGVAVQEDHGHSVGRENERRIIMKEGAVLKWLRV